MIKTPIPPLTEAELERLKIELTVRAEKVNTYLLEHRYLKKVTTSHIRDGITWYIEQGGKRLRPFLVMVCCGAVGGSEMNVLPAAAAVELFHTWTLVHDDIIDRDDTRRGNPTAHKEFATRSTKEWSLDTAEAAHYGLTVGILSGDVQHGWAVTCLCELARNEKVSRDVVLELIHDMECQVVSELVDGEIRDVQYTYLPIEEITLDDILSMLYRKTGVLFEFCTRLGASIGLNNYEPEANPTAALAGFAHNAGVGFQLQDDILGILGDAKKLGKPVGSDIREGKCTTIVHYALESATDKEKAFILKVLGNPNASPEDIEKTKNLLVDLGGVLKTKELSSIYINKAFSFLGQLQSNPYSELLKLWGRYMVNREF